MYVKRIDKYISRREYIRACFFLLWSGFFRRHTYACKQARALGKQNFSLKMKKNPLFMFPLPPLYLYHSSWN